MRVNIDDAFNVKIVQVRIDSLSVNRLVVATYSSNPKMLMKVRLFVLSVGGSEQILVGEDFYADEWIVNKHNAALVARGRRDFNLNGKRNKNDGPEILIYIY